MSVQLHKANARGREVEPIARHKATSSFPEAFVCPRVTSAQDQPSEQQRLAERFSILFRRIGDVFQEGRLGVVFQLQHLSVVQHNILHALVFKLKQL